MNTYTDFHMNMPVPSSGAMAVTGNTSAPQASESEARLHHLEEHRDRATYAAHVCFDCESTQHASGTCKQTAVFMSGQFFKTIEDMAQCEQFGRHQISSGIPYGAPACTYHRTQLQQVSTSRGFHSTANTLVTALSETITAETAMTAHYHKP